MADYGTDMPADISDRFSSGDNANVAIQRIEHTNNDIARRLGRKTRLSFDGRQSLDTCPVAESKPRRPSASTRGNHRWWATETMTAGSRRGPPSSVRKQRQDLRQVDRGLGRSHARQPQVRVRIPPRGGSAAGTEMRRV